jgi:hypothetical protein
MIRRCLIVASSLGCFSSVTSVHADASALAASNAVVLPPKPFGGGKNAAGKWANAGFELPVAVTRANGRSAGSWGEIGDADWSCLGTPRPDQPSTQTILLSGEVDDWQTGSPVGNATIVAFPGNLVTGNAGTATTSNVVSTRGDFAMTVAKLAAGTTRVGFRIDASGYVRTYVLDEYLDPSISPQTRALLAWSESTANALTAFLGITRDPADGMVMGTMHDCAGHEVSNAIATVSWSSAAAKHVRGAATFYFSATSQSTPVPRAQSPSTNADGMFVVLGLPPTSTAFVQVWGFTSKAKLEMGSAGLELLAERPLPIEANAMFTTSLSPRRS